MEYQNKTKEQLLEELKKLQSEIDTLKNSHKSTKSELSGTKEFLKGILDNNPISIQIADYQGFTVQANAAYVSLFGVEPSLDHSVFNDKQIMEAGYGGLLKQLKKGEIVRIPDLQYIIDEGACDKKAKYVWLRIVAFPIKSSSGKPEQFVIMHHNITERKENEKALQEREENYRLLLNLAPDAFFQGDDLGNIILVNEKAELMLGYTGDEILAMNMQSFFSESELNKKPLRYDLLDRGETITAEREIIRKDGGTTIVEMTSRKMPDSSYQSFWRDISERKRSELAIKESEQLYRTIFENTGTAFIIIDEDTTILLTNSEWVNLAGYTREELEGKMSWTQFVVPKDLERMKEYHKTRRLNPDGAPHKYEFRFIRRNGEIRDMINIVAMIPGTTRSIASLMDITERKQAEEKVRGSENWLKTIIETSPDSIAISSLTGEVQFVTKQTVSLWGFDSETDIIGKNVLDFVDSNYKEKAQYLVSELIKGNITGAAEYLMVRNDGSKFYCESNANILHNSKNLPVGVLYINRDISARKQVEHDLIKAKEIAEESESKFRLIFENAPLGIFHYNRNGEINSCNDMFVEIIGSSKAALIGLNINKLPDKQLVGALEESMLGNIGFYEDYYHSTTANKITPVQVLFAPIFSGNNEVVGGVGIVQDITERKKNEQILQEQNEEYLALNEELLQTNEELYKAKGLVEKSEEKFRLMFKNSNDVFVLINGKGEQIYISDAAVRDTGYSLDELKGPIQNVIYPDDLDIVLKVWNEVLTTKDEVFRVQYRHIHKTKGFIWYEAVVQNFIDNPLINAVVVNVREITAMKEFERELIKAKQKAEENEAKYKTMVSILPDGVIIHQDGKIVFGNEAAARIVKSDNLQSLMGLSVLSFVHPDYRDTALKRIRESMANKVKAETIEEKFICLDGEPIDVLVTAYPFIYEGKQSMLTVFTNISSIKQFEKELIEAKEKAEESDRLKSAFLANMSHEIRTPMNGILGFADLLKQPRLSGEQQQEYIKIIEKSGARMLGIINNIIDISKIESGQMNVTLSVTNINEQVKYLYDFFKLEAETKGLQLVLSNNVNPSDVLILTDKEKLYAILTNLIKNAIKFTDNGKVEIGYSKKNNHLEFYVKDTGIGIPDDRKEAIFERFVQADISDKRAFQGAGLGLAITKAFVEMLGGKIWVESSEQEGTTFYFTILCNKNQEGNKMKTSLEPLNVKDKKQPKLSVLIAEDDAMSDMLITIMLSKFNFDILHSKSGVEAVNLCQQKPDIDLILMDIKMPILDGYEATKQIREFNKDVVIIAQTAHALAGDREKAIEAGCTDYITKPVSFDLLVALIDKYF